MSYVHADVAVGVDPEFVLTSNVAKNKKSVLLVQETSDYFFSSFDPVAMLGGPPNLVFLDGLHTFEFLLRDFANSEFICRRSSLIVLHDCLPLDDIMTTRHLEEWKLKTPGSRYEGFWTGDVWKIIPILMKFRPDLRIVFVDCPPTGLVCTSNLDPTSTILMDNYHEIVTHFRSLSDDRLQIGEMYAKIEIVSGDAITREFDHSLYFST